MTPVNDSKSGRESAGRDSKGGKEKKGSVEEEYLIRANTIAGYWELNRRLLRSIPPPTSASSSSSNTITNNTSSPRSTFTNSPINSQITPTPLTSISNSNEDPISSSAQISFDTLLGESTRVGERASIKKSVIGRHCVIGRGAKITGCVLWDFVTVEEK